MSTNFAPGSGMGELQHRMSACMMGTQPVPVPAAAASVAHEAVACIEMELFRQGWPVGRSLGALQDVQKQLGLGRPTSREAITILEARGMLDIRRGPGGGLFVAAPSLDDVAGSILMYLALAGETYACIEEFRLLTWRMIVKTAIDQHTPLPQRSTVVSEWGLAADLAERTGNRTMGLLARLSELLIRIAQGKKAPDCDPVLEAAIQSGNCVKAFERLDKLFQFGEKSAPIIAFDVVERGFSLAGRKSAMALAVRMARELSGPGSTQEAEWETAQRLGYTENVVRQARRILQDFGVLRCRRGRKGAEFAPPTAPTGVIRLLAPSLVTSTSLAVDIREVIFFLVGSATVLAANRVNAEGHGPFRIMAPSSNLDPLEALTLENRLMELSGNPLLAIVVRSLGLANTFIAKDELIPPHLGKIMTLNRRILRMIDLGDAAAARSLAQTKFDLMQRRADFYQDVA